MTKKLRLQAIEAGTKWGQEEAEIAAGVVRLGYHARWPEWTMGAWEGPLPKGSESLRWEYEKILDQAARAAYEEARAARP